MHLSLRAIAVLSIALLCGLARGQDLVGKMGPVELRVDEIRAVLQAQPEEVRRQLSADLSQLDRFVRNELVRRAILAEAREKNWESRPDVTALVRHATEQVIASHYVAQVSRVPPEYPSAEEIAAFYDRNRTQLLAPAQYRLAQIFVASADDADRGKATAAMRKATELGERATSPGADFAELARAHSEHADSAPRGGELGWVREDQVIPEIRRMLPGLSSGEVSAPVRSAQGWHIVKLLDSRPAAVRPLAEVRDAIAATMRQQRAQERERAFLESVASRAAMTVNQIELEKLQSQLR